MSRINRDNYFVVQGWMVTELGLKGNDLLIYSIIHGFSQSGDGQAFTGTLSYLADWANVSKVAVMNTLNRLIDKGLLDKQEELRNGVKFCRYRTNFTGGKETLPGGKESLLGGGKETLPNNNIAIDTIKQNKTKSDDLDSVLCRVDVTVRDTVREFIKMRKAIKAPMTDRAIALMIDKLNGMTADPETQIEILNQSIENSWKGIYELKQERKTGVQNRVNWDINRGDDDPYAMITAMAERGIR